MSNTINSALLWPMAIKVANTLREEAGLLGVVQHDFDPAPAAVGETVTVGMAPPLGTASAVTPAAYLQALPSDMTLKYQQISLASWVKQEFYLSSRDCAKLRLTEWVPQQMVQAVRSVLAHMRSATLTALLGVNGHVHTSNSAIFNSTDNVGVVIDAKKQLLKQLAPSSGKKVLVISPEEEANALKLNQFLAAYAAGDTQAFQSGATGNRLGFEWHVDNAGIIPVSHTAGTDNGSYVLDGAHPAGTTSLTLKSGSGTILAGDIVTITNAAGLGTFTYSVKTALNGTTLIINEPGLMVAGATNDTVITAATHTIGAYAFDPNAIMLVSRTPSTPDVQLGTSQIVTDPVTNLSLKLSLIPGDEAQVWRISVLYGCGLVDPRLGVRLSY